MSRNSLIIAGIAVVALIILFAVFNGGGNEAPNPEAEAPAPQTND